MTTGSAILHVASDYQPLIRQVGIDADSVFEDPRIVVWRDIAERQNCTLDETFPDGRKVRLHIKRFKHSGDRDAEAEVAGIRLLQQSGIPTVPLVGWGRNGAGRGFVISDDLAGFDAGDKAVTAGKVMLEALLDPVAALAARLHREGLHHRDLYLCHFFVRREGGTLELRVIDAARVRRLPRWPFARRWVVKDLAQLVYSLRQAGATREQTQRVLQSYAKTRALGEHGGLTAAVERKASAIARHDAKLQVRSPGRGVSL